MPSPLAPTRRYGPAARSSAHSTSWSSGGIARALRPPSPGAAQSATPQAAGLVVEHDEAELHYDGSTYRTHQRRKLFNAGDTPITRYLIRVSVDRHPGDPERSNQLYREHPLTWDELELNAMHDGKHPMRWRVRYDRDAFKELWLCFENQHGHLPL
jgi:hypothetical protein